MSKDQDLPKIFVLVHSETNKIRLSNNQRILAANLNYRYTLAESGMALILLLLQVWKIAEWSSYCRVSKSLKESCEGCLHILSKYPSKDQRFQEMIGAVQS